MNFVRHWAIPGAAYYTVLENAIGVGGYLEIGNNIINTEYRYRIAVHLQDWQNARYQIEAYADNGNRIASSTELGSIDGLLASIGLLQPASLGAGDWFGNSVSLSGDGQTLVVGAFGTDSNPGAVDNLPDVGSVHVFRFDATSLVNGGWSTGQQLMTASPEVGELFGWSVDLSSNGQTLAVGARDADSNPGAVDNLLDVGAVHIFRFDATNLVNGGWGPGQQLMAASPAAVDRFGWSVRFSGDSQTLVVGAPHTQWHSLKKKCHSLKRLYLPCYS